MSDVRSITWVSFVGGEGGPGVVILRGSFDVMAAVSEAWRLKINPGGEVMCCSVTSDQIEKEEFDRMWENDQRLFSHEEIRSLFEIESVRS